MEHRFGHRVSSRIPVRLRCVQSRDTGCRCLGCVENLSAGGALIRTELGIRPAADVVVETLVPALGLQGRELPASIVRESSGELAVQWMDLASTGVSAVMTEVMLNGGRANGERPVPTLGRVLFCALASPAAA
jgi:PilZ domain-containing protein